MKKLSILVSLVMLVVLVLSACAPQATATPAAEEPVVEVPVVEEPVVEEPVVEEPVVEEPAAEEPVVEEPAAEESALDPAVLEFYKGKTVTIYTTAAAGSSSDLWARTMAKYLPEVTGADYVVVNENAGGGLVIMNQLTNTIEPDGLSMLWTVTGSIFPPALQGEESVEYDLSQLHYIGGIIKGNTLLGVSLDGDIQSAEDLLNATEPLTFSTTRPNTAPSMANALVVEILTPPGSSIISGFDGSTGKLLAVQQGDVNGTVSSADSILKAEADGQLKAILQIGLTRTPPAENLPCLADLVDVNSLNEFQQKLIGTIDLLYDVNQALMAPGVPEERVAFMEAALKMVFENPEFKAEIEQVSGNAMLPYVSGAEVTAVVENLMAKQADIPVWGELLAKVVK